MANYSLNIDIVNRQLQILEASNTKDSLQITACAREAFDPQGGVKLEPVLKRLIPARGASERFVGTSLWTATTIVRRIQIPVMSASELKSAIRYEFEKHIPFPIAECYADHYVIRKLGMNERMEVMLVSAKKEVVDERRRLLSEAGWEPRVVDVHPFALANLFNFFQGKSRSAPAALIHLGTVDGFALPGPNFVTVLKDAQPVVVRDLGEETTPGDGRIADEVLERMGQTVRQSIEFYENAADEAVNDVFVSGRGALDEAVKALERTTEARIRCWSVADKLQYASAACREAFRKDEQDLLILAGLALRGLKS